MAEPIVVVGAGGFGREVLDVIDAINAAAESPVWDVLGVVDDGLAQVNSERLTKRRVPFLGVREDVLRNGEPTNYVVGIGSPKARRKIADEFDASGWQAVSVVHPTATQGFDVRIGEGTVICAGVGLTTNIALGRHVHLNPAASIGHDTELGDFVSVNPRGSISGDVTIEDDVLIGVAGVILNGLRVGRGSTIGGSACVVRDVAADSTMVGVPAAPLTKGGSL